MRVTVNWDQCDGNGVCEAEAPEVFELDDDGDLHLRSERFGAAELAQVEAAVRACPKHALSIER